MLKEGNVHVTHGKEHISISRLNAEEAKLLDAQEGTPVFYKASHERDENNGFVEYCKAVILPTKYRFADNGEADGVADEGGCRMAEAVGGPAGLQANSPLYCGANRTR